MSTSNIAAFPAFISNLKRNGELKGASVDSEPKVGQKLYVFIPSIALPISIGRVTYLSYSQDKRSYFVETTRTRGLNLSHGRGKRGSLLVALRKKNSLWRR